MSFKKAGLVGLLAAAALAIPASAATVEELQAQVNALLAQLAGLQGGGSSEGCYSFTVDLTEGSTGADVTALQNYLAGTGHFTAAATGYFGAITKAAVAAWQSANGVAPAAGYFGAISRAKYNMMCGSTSGGDDSTSGGNDDFFTGDDEGSLENIDQLSKYSNEEVGEDEEDVVVLGLEAEADGADQMVERVTVVIDNPNGGGVGASEKLEDYITDVSVWFNGEEMDRMDVEDASYDRANDEYTFRFVGLDGVIEDGDTGEVMVAVTGISNLDSGDDHSWDVEIPNDGIRASSPNGVTESYDGVGPEGFDVVSFSTANDVELKASKSSDNPEEQTVVGDSNGEFNADLLGFELAAEGSDIEVFSLEFDLTSSDPNVPDLVSSLTLTCDGDEWTETGATTTVFEDLEFSVGEDDSVECVLSAELNEIDGTIFAEGATLSADLDTSETDAEDESSESLAGGDLTGSANGNDQTFISEGIEISNWDTSASKTTPGNTGEEAIGTYVFEFDVTANDSDVYLDKSDEEIDGLDGGADNGTGEAGEGVVYTVSGDFGGEGFATSTAVLECISGCGSTSDNLTNKYFIADGDTETYRLTVTVTARQLSTQTYGVWIDSINWTTDATNDDLAGEFYTSNLGDDSEADAGILTMTSI